MAQEGIHVTRLTSEQRAAWKAYGDKSWDKFEEVIGKEMMDIIRKNAK